MQEGAAVDERATSPGRGREARVDRVRSADRRCRMKHAPPSRRDRLRHMLADLRLPGALEALDAILQGVDGGALTTPEAIEPLLSAQIQLRNNRRLQAAMRSSRLPAVKQLHDFDFTFQPSLRREQIERSARARVRRARRECDPPRPARRRQDAL